VVAVMKAHVNAAAGRQAPGGTASPAAYGAAVAGGVIGVLVAMLAASRPLLGVSAPLLAAVLAWPWVSRRGAPGTRLLRAPSGAWRTRAMLVAPLWALLSPAGLASVGGVQLHLLHSAVGLDLWHVPVLYSLVLLGSLWGMALVMRLIIRSWRLRLEGVMLLAFLLLLAAMFISQLYSKTPPPASDVQINVPATIGVGLLALLAGATLRRLNRRRILNSA